MPRFSKCDLGDRCYGLSHTAAGGRKMKRSKRLTLVIFGALLTGCDDPSDPSNNRDQYGRGQSMTNNTYAPGHGYYHAPYHGWYPYPYNSYHPGLGYYHGGDYSPAPHTSPVTASRPVGSSARASFISRRGVRAFGASAS